MSHGAMNLKFTEGRLAQVLVAPIVSEKATSVAEKHNQVLFKVLRDASKLEIKAAVELMFKVEVDVPLVIDLAKKVEVGLYALDDFFYHQTPRNGLLMGFGAIETLDIDIALDRLREILRQVA